MYRLHLGNIWKDLTLVVFAKKSAQRFCTVGATCQLWVRFISAKEKCSTRKMSQSWSTFHLQKSMFWAWFWRAFHTFSCSGPPSLGMNCLTLSDTVQHLSSFKTSLKTHLSSHKSTAEIPSHLCPFSSSFSVVVIMTCSFSSSSPPPLPQHCAHVCMHAYVWVFQMIYMYKCIPGLYGFYCKVHRAIE